MSKPSPARDRMTNWSSYTVSLRKRGSLLIWLDNDMIWLAQHYSSRILATPGDLQSSRMRRSSSA